MSTTAQIEANTRNAVRPGLTSVQLIQPGENQAEYEALETSLTNDWNPASTTEFSLVKEIAQSYWKLQRIRRVESSLLEPAITVEHREFCERHKTEFPLDAASADSFLVRGLEARDGTFQLLGRHATQYERAWYRAIHKLTKLQAERRKPKPAAPIGFVQQNEPHPVTLENASPEIQKLILDTSAQLVQKFMRDNGFVSQNSTKSASGPEVEAASPPEPVLEAA